VVQPWWAGVTGAADAARAYARLQIGVEVFFGAGIFLLGWLRRRPAGSAAA